MLPIRIPIRHCKICGHYRTNFPPTFPSRECISKTTLTKFETSSHPSRFPKSPNDDGKREKNKDSSKFDWAAFDEGSDLALFNKYHE